METKEQKPWYHGVKWSWDRQELHLIEGGDYVIRDGETEVVQLEPLTTYEDGSEDYAFVCNIPSHNKDWAKLIAAAPETATERDELLSVQKQLVEALKIAERNLVSSIPYSCGVRRAGLESAIDTVRAAILAAKASS